MLNHPGNAVGYRLDWEGKSLAIITDTEHEPGGIDETVLDLIRDTDLFLYDAMFTDDEMGLYRGYGHSSWQQAIRLAQLADAKNVGFIHHAPSRSDEELDMIEKQAKAVFSGAFAAMDGQVIEI